MDGFGTGFNVTMQRCTIEKSELVYDFCGVLHDCVSCVCARVTPGSDCVQIRYKDRDSFIVNEYK